MTHLHWVSCLLLQEKELEAERQKKQNKVMELDPEKLRKIAERKRKKLEKEKEKQALLAAANAGNDPASQNGNENSGFAADNQPDDASTKEDNFSQNASRFSMVS